MKNELNPENSVTRENPPEIFYQKVNLVEHIFFPLCIVLIFFFCHQGETFVPSLLLQRFVLLLGGYFIALQDFKEKIIPNQWVLYLLFGWILTVIPQMLNNMEGFYPSLIHSAFGFLIGGGLFLFIYLISHQNIGAGDVKFIAVVGLFLGMDLVLQAMVYGSLMVSFFTVIMVFLKKLTVKDTIPLAPFLYAGIFLTLLWSAR